jgi:hypothetical protein
MLMLVIVIEGESGSITSRSTSNDYEIGYRHSCFGYLR